MMNCQFTISNGLATCQLCGFSFTTKQDDPERIHKKCDGRICQFELIEDAKIRCVRCNHIADYDLAGPTVRKCDNPGPGMGDLIKSTLETVGITDELVSRYWGDCRCGARRAMLNAATPAGVKRFLTWFQSQPEADRAADIEEEMNKSL